MGLLSNKISRDELKPGDHIYSWRQAYIYAHHGIYVGEGKVIHFTQGEGQEIGTGTSLGRVILSSSPLHPLGIPCPDCGDQSRLSGVICSCLDCFLSGGDIYLFKYGVSSVYFLATRGGTCTVATAADSQESVLHRARFLLENGFGAYHVSKKNCEDFAVYCKTSRVVATTNRMGLSGQATSLSNAASAFASSGLRYLTLGSGPVSAVVSYGVYYSVSRLYSDIGVRKDAVIVPVESLIPHSVTQDGTYNALEVERDALVQKLKILRDEICFELQQLRTENAELKASISFWKKLLSVVFVIIVGLWLTKRN